MSRALYHIDPDVQTVRPLKVRTPIKSWKEREMNRRPILMGNCTVFVADTILR